ncbi:MAG TPA: Rieske 2Fe-2S domain-containing protein [Candidatus Limnocylindrales bacterium]|nr:Rieske 2Fe-2S domain-containing protein [Candidatus Limnocylindrales bacterium]
MQPTSVDRATSGDPATTEDLSRGIASPGRRRFLRAALSFSVVSTIAMILTPIVGFLIPPKSSGGAGVGRIPVGTTADLPVGNGTVVAMGSKPVIVVNTTAGIKAYSAVCTHLGCIVAFDPTADAIICPCHDGRFSPTNGSVISGPPPQPLPPIAVAVEKDQIFLVSG